jgi:ABC-type dipeptide/oligopeptide/nickel transport system permease subunit
MTDKQGAGSQGLYHRIWRNFAGNRIALIGAILIFGYIGVALSAPVLYPGDPALPDLSGVLKFPSMTHPLGTDELGRSILGRIIWGSRVSLAIAFTVVAVGMSIGIPIGLVSGYYRGRVDFVIQRLTDILLAFPGFLLALALIAVLGVGFANTVISVAISMVPQYIRLVRGSVLSVREQVYIEAARALGTRNVKILWRHILPNVMVPIIVQTTLNLGVAILFAAGLGFLGVGIQPPTPEWGTMLGTGRIYIFRAPHVATFPGLAIFLAVLGFNLMGDGLRDALDPRFDPSGV